MPPGVRRSRSSRRSLAGGLDARAGRLLLSALARRGRGGGGGGAQRLGPRHGWAGQRAARPRDVAVALSAGVYEAGVDTARFLFRLHDERQQAGALQMWGGMPAKLGRMRV